jgi:molybdopterin converting factor small subunit
VFHIPGPLRDCAAGSSSVEIPGKPATLRDAFELLCSLHPGIRDRVFTEQGQIRQHINVFVGTEDVRYTGGLATRITEADTISILPAVSGG